MDGSEELATVVERPRARTSTAIAPASRDDSRGDSHGLQALRADEIKRIRGIAAILAVLVTAAGSWFVVLGGDPRYQVPAVIACAYLAIVCVVVLLRARQDRYYRWLFRWFGASCVLVSIIATLHIGLFSPAPVVVSFGIAFFGGADDRTWGVGCCLVATALYMLVALLILVEVVPDAGLIRGLTSFEGRLFGVVMVPAVYLGSMWQSVLSRRATQDALAQVEAAAREVQQREAQLAEARLDLEHVLEAGAGRRGRYTGRKAGVWTFGEVIGRGAMGEVYAASHDNTGDRAAIKTLLASASAQIDRFRREVEIASRVRARGIVNVYEVGTLDDDVPYLVMELLAGHDLAWHLRQAPVLALEAAVELGTELAEALAVAHRAGIVHRDIKPQNVFRHEPPDERPQWKVLDFGVSKLRDSTGTLTRNMVVGTPGYMSPEQARGESTDERSDLFSLGAVLYRALTGQQPFRGKDTPQILFDVCYRSPSRPSDLVPRLPTDVDLFLAIALAKLPSARFATAVELSRALQSAARGELAPELRGRGRDLVQLLPWGARVRADSLRP